MPTLIQQHTIAALQNGDRNALDEIFDEFFNALCFFANKYLDDKLESEDIVIHAFFKLWERRDTFVSVSSIKAFLYISVKNACLNKIRAGQTKKRLIKVYHESNNDNLYEEDAESRRIRSEVMRFIYAEIERLPSEARKVFEMYYFDDQTTAQIARQLDISESTVRNQKARALLLLKTKLKPQQWILFLLIITDFCRFIHKN
jgi:RNA polymerase sigma-70 factor (family 1)